MSERSFYSDDDFSKDEFYTLRGPKTILVLDEKEYKNDYSDVKEFVIQLLKKCCNEDQLFQIKGPNGEVYNAIPTHFEPIYIGFQDEMVVELVEMVCLILDGEYNKYVRISNKFHLFGYWE